MWLNSKEILRQFLFHRLPEKLKIEKSDIGSNQISKKKVLSHCSGSSYQLPVTELVNKLHASVNQMIILLAESHSEPAESTQPHQTQLLSKIHPILRTSFLLIPRSEALLEKLTVYQLVKKFLALS
jgi:hypothetical protein